MTVTGKTADLTTMVDRRSFVLGRDVLSSTGTLADALRNVPGVDVDLQGNVSLRGDSNVTILIDGKPSGLLQGGSGLQQLPAQRFERVEVMANPSAAYTAEGSAGIINLITKKVGTAGYAVSTRLNAGSEGRDNGGVNATYGEGSLSLSGDLSVRQEPQKTRFTEDRIEVSGAGASRDVNAATGLAETYSGRGGVEYRLDPTTTLSGELRLNDFHNPSDLFETFTGGDAFAGQSPFNRVGNSDYRRLNTEGLVQISKGLSSSGQHLIASARIGETETEWRRRNLTSFAALAPPSADLIDGTTLGWDGDLKIDYTDPKIAGGKLKLGYDLLIARAHLDAFGAVGPTPDALAVAPGLTDGFGYQSTVNAAYVTFERTLGDLQALIGLRAEQTHLGLDQRTTLIRSRQDYTIAYPTLHLSYKMSDDQKATLSYGRRVQRPRPEELNPFAVFQDPLNLRAGNPDLKPQQTDSFEAGYELRHNSSYYVATLFFRNTKDGFADVISDAGDGVLLTRRENVAINRNVGLEGLATGRIVQGLTYNLSADLYWNEIEAPGLALQSRRSILGVGGKANLNWQVATNDLIQVNIWVSPKRLIPQGERAGSGALNVGYRHKFNDRMSGVIVISDALRSFRDDTRFDAVGLIDQVDRRVNSRSIFFGLNWGLGGGGRRPLVPGFEFSNGPSS